MTIHFTAIDTETANAYRAGKPDDYGHKPERAISEGDGIPCRHCLKMVPKGQPYLVVAHRPFDGLNPYTETGPIFLCEHGCNRGGGDAALPEFLDSPGYIVRGYGANERIVYGSGGVVERDHIPERAETLLARDDIEFVHVRSASNNCFHCRIDVVEG
ncbi:MAG: DUF1203 domain-containing protein [Pseudomonadota bacterium]